MTEKSNDWKLKKLALEFNTYGDDKGQYTGSIHFQNGEYEGFNFKIRPDLADGYIDLIAKDIVKAADSLAERLVASLQLRER